MNWSKVTSIMIAVFLAVNIFLGGNILFAYLSSNFPSKEYVQSTEKVLLNNGVTIDRSLLLREFEKPVSRHLFFDQKFEEYVAKKIFGSQMNENISSTTTLFTEDTSSLSLQGGVKFEFKGILDLSVPGEKIKGTIDSQISQARKFLKILSPDTTPFLIETKTEGEETKITFGQEYKGKKISQNMVVFTVLNGTIVQGKGDYVYGHISSNELPIPKDPVDALFTYATSVKGEEETKILELTIEYIVNKQAQGTYLNPVWKIKDDSDKEYFFDLSGNVVV